MPVVARSDELRRQLIAGSIVAVLVLAVIFGGRLFRAAVDLWNGFAIEPLERVHAQLLPMWVLSVTDTPGAQPEPEAYEELQAALQDGRADALPGLIDELRTALRRGDAQRYIELLRAWNDALDAEGVPFVVRGDALTLRRGRTQFFLTSARTLTDVGVPVGEAEVRVRVVERIDGTNIRESVLGENAETVEGGLVLSDRVLEFTLDQVWPLLDDTATKPAWALAFADEVRDEVQRDLSAEHFELLEGLAAARLNAVEAALGIQARSACSGFRFIGVAWQGPNPRDRALLERVVDDRGDCPKVYRAELEAIEAFGDAASASEGLEEALGALLAWSMRPIAIHEARHAADAAQTGALDVPVPCSGCDGLSVRERAELSAYAAEFAWTDTPAAAIYQACLAMGARGGSHRGALEFLFEQLDGDCIFGLGDQQAVRAFAKRSFDRRDPVVLPAAFDDDVPLPPRAVAKSAQ